MSRDRLLVALAVLCAAGLAATWAVAVRTDRGRSLDRSAFERLTGNAPPPYRTVGERTLRTVDAAGVAAGLLALAGLAFLRRRYARAAVAVAIVALSVGTAEGLKHGMPFPAGRPPTFPSGHTALAVSLGLALVVAVPQGLRPLAALAGAAYAAAIAFSVVVLAWHYPSDAIASFFVCGTFAAAGALCLRGSPRRPSLSLGGVAAAVVAVAVALVVAAVVASHHPAAVAAVRSRPAVAAAAAAYGLLSLAVFALAAAVFTEGRR